MGMLPECATPGCEQSHGHPYDCFPGVPSPGYPFPEHYVATRPDPTTIVIACGRCGLPSNPDHGLPFRCDWCRASETTSVPVDSMRRFQLHRDVDASGVSGTGIVADGVEFHTEQCVLCWRTATTSVAVYRTAAELMHIHGHGGATRLVWIDGAPPALTAPHTTDARNDP